jgi:hypothetical protein
MTQRLEQVRRGYHGVTIVALSKYPQIFEGFDENVRKFVTNPNINKILVRDGALLGESIPGWLTLSGPRVFSMTGNANIGFKAVDPDDDILYIGDDVRFTQMNTIERLKEIADTNPRIGLISPKINGGADNYLQTNPPTDKKLVFSDKYLALVCTYITREALNAIGFLDEDTFKGYGWDDVDYSRRVRQAGFKLAVAPQVEVNHGLKRQGTETFLLNEKGYYDELQKQSDENAKAFFKKWGDNNK